MASVAASAQTLRACEMVGVRAGCMDTVLKGSGANIISSGRLPLGVIVCALSSVSLLRKLARGSCPKISRQASMTNTASRFPFTSSFELAYRKACDAQRQFEGGGTCSATRVGTVDRRPPLWFARDVG